MVVLDQIHIQHGLLQHLLELVVFTLVVAVVVETQETLQVVVLEALEVVAEGVMLHQVTHQ